MPRRRYATGAEVEVRPPRDERVIIYCTKEHKKLWEKATVDMEVSNYEEAMVKLIQLYELTSKYLKEKRIDELIKRLNDVLGLSVRMKIIS